MNVSSRLRSGSAARQMPLSGKALPYAMGAGAVVASLVFSAFLNAQLAKRAERKNPPLGRFVDVEGVRLHYLDRGTGQPLVLLHGNGSMVQDFESSELISLASKHFRVIAFDRPGFGQSTRPRQRTWNAQAQAELFSAALNKIGVSQAIICGHSWGASAAVALALKHPTQVSGLVLASGYYYPTPRLDALLLSAPAFPLLGDVIRYSISPILSRLLWPSIARKLFAPEAIPSKFKLFPKEMTFRPSQIRAAAAEGAMMIPDAYAACAGYKRLTMPVAIIAGDQDQLIDIEAQSARLHRNLPGSAMFRIRGAGHMVHQTATQTVMTAIRQIARMRDARDVSSITPA